MVLEGAASRFRGWRNMRRREGREHAHARRAAVAQMCAAGLEPGAQVRFRYRGKLYHGEVVRINPKTVTVGEPGKGRGLLRVPYERILGIIRRGRVTTGPASGLASGRMGSGYARSPRDLPAA